MAASFAKTAQIISTMTPRWRDRLDAYAVANEQSRADAIRSLVEREIISWERTNGLTWIDSSQLAEGDSSAQ